MQSASNGMQAFALGLNKRLADDAGRSGNLVYSPLSIYAALSLVLANAIYFKGRWEKPFHESRTKDDKFHRLDGTHVDVPFMRDSGRRLLACHDGFKVLQLHYERGRPLPAQPAPIYSMCVFLPDARDGLWRLTDKISCDPGFLRKHLPRSTVMVDDIRLPKFKISFSNDVAGSLRALGVREAFDQEKADLSDMAEDGAGGRRRLALQQVLHKAVLEVNEEGTEAAAATSTMLCMSSAQPQPRPPPVEFVADHPFAFFVIEEVSGAILFAGHVVDPSIN